MILIYCAITLVPLVLIVLAIWFVVTCVKEAHRRLAFSFTKINNK